MPADAGFGSVTIDPFDAGIGGGDPVDVECCPFAILAVVCLVFEKDDLTNVVVAA
jgi:hypothetical protein